MKRAKTPKAIAPPPNTPPPPPPSQPERNGHVTLTIGQVVAQKDAQDELPPLLNAFRKLRHQSYSGFVAYQIQIAHRVLTQAFADYESVRTTTIERLGEPHPQFGYWIPDHNGDCLRELQVVLRDLCKQTIELPIQSPLPFPTRGEFTGVEIGLLDEYGLIAPPAGFTPSPSHQPSPQS